MSTEEESLSSMISYTLVSLALGKISINLHFHCSFKDSPVCKCILDHRVKHKSHSPYATIVNRVTADLEKLAFFPHNTWKMCIVIIPLLRQKRVLLIPRRANIVEPWYNPFNRISYEININWCRQVEFCKVCIADMFDVNWKEMSFVEKSLIKFTNI